MLFQGTSPLLFLVWLILATVIVTLIIYIAVDLVESKTKASDKKYIILLIAFLAVVVLPFIVGIIGIVLGALGNLLAMARSLIDGGGQNFLVRLLPIIFFILLLLLIKFLIDMTWESSLWVSLLTLFVLYIIYSLIPELYNFIGFA